MTHNPFRRLAGLALALVLLCGTAFAGTAFSFRSGIDWTTAPAQMLAAEGVSEDDGSYNEEYINGFYFYYLKAQNAYYVFRGELLLQAYTVQAADAYAQTLEAQTVRYGAPVEVSADTVAALWNTFVPNAVMPEMLSNLIGWQLSDGTLAALFILEGKACMAYFNQQQM
ncbi:MAG TPA: hypothetical protein PKU80_13290 [Candidatus Limiplasma sp.]|nr:hypothetical protein [Candidatus Limiplasma sp.]